MTDGSIATTVGNRDRMDRYDLLLKADMKAMFPILSAQLMLKL